MKPQTDHKGILRAATYYWNTTRFQTHVDAILRYGIASVGLVRKDVTEGLPAPLLNTMRVRPVLLPQDDADHRRILAKGERLVRTFLEWEAKHGHYSLVKPEVA